MEIEEKAIGLAESSVGSQGNGLLRRSENLSERIADEIRRLEGRLREAREDEQQIDHVKADIYDLHSSAAEGKSPEGPLAEKVSRFPLPVVRAILALDTNPDMELYEPLLNIDTAVEAGVALFGMPREFAVEHFGSLAQLTDMVRRGLLTFESAEDNLRTLAQKTAGGTDNTKTEAIWAAIRAIETKNSAADDLGRVARELSEVESRYLDGFEKKSQGDLSFEEIMQAAVRLKDKLLDGYDDSAGYVARDVIAAMRLSDDVNDINLRILWKNGSDKALEMISAVYGVDPEAISPLVYGIGHGLGQMDLGGFESFSNGRPIGSNATYTLGQYDGLVVELKERGKYENGRKRLALLESVVED
jgi:hypothetical protein